MKTQTARLERLLSDLTLCAAMGKRGRARFEAEVDARKEVDRLSLVRGRASFLIGMILALHFSRPLAQPDSAPPSLQGAVCLIIVVCAQQGEERGATLAFCLLVYASQFSRGILYRIARLRPFRRIGDLSYSVNLGHAVLLQVIALVWDKANTVLNLGPVAGLVAVGFTTAVISLTTAVVSYRYLEIPARTWLKHRLLSRQA